MTFDRYLEHLRQRLMPAKRAGRARAFRRLAAEQFEDRTLPAVTLLGMPDWVDQGSKPMLNGSTASDPGNPAGGAVEDLAIDPNNPARMFAGTVNGGIWRTTNGTRPFNGVDDDGANGVDDPLEQPDWFPLTDDFPSLSIGDIRFSPLDPTGNTVFAGTGSTSSLGNTGGPAIGIFRTTDGGNTWTVFPVTPGPGEPQVRAVLPTTFDGNAAPGVQQVVMVGTTAGLFRSTDAGQNYTPIGAANGLLAGTVTQIVADPNNASQFFAGVVGRGVFVSTNGGLNWAPVNTNITNVAGSTTVEVAAHPGGGTTVLHALVSGPNPIAYTSNNGGTAWTALAALPAGFTSGNNGLYTTFAADQLVINPANAAVVYLAKGYGGSPFVLRYNPAGAGSWDTIENPGAAGNTRPHVDSRDLQFATVGGVDHLIHSNDGGMYFLRDPQNAAANRWTSLHGRGANGLGATEYHNVAWDSRFDVIAGGAQDNGTTVQNGTGDVVWTTISGNDGGDMQIDTVNAGAGRSFRYSSSQNFGWLRRHTFDSATNQPVAAVDLFPAGGLAGFNAPFVPLYELNSVNLTRLVTGETFSTSPGTNTVYELTNAATAPNAAGATWVAVPLGAGFGTVDGRALAVGGMLGGVANAEVLVVGSNGNIFTRSTAGGTLTATTTNFPGGTVQDIVLDPLNWQHFFACDGAGVWETTDAGTTWNNLTLNLASVNNSLLSIEFVPSGDTVLVNGNPQSVGTVVVGGQLGVSRLPMGVAGSQWTRFGLGLPNALAFDLDYNADDHVLLVGTFGRGAWTVPNVEAVIAQPPVLIVSGDDLFPNQDDVIRLVRNAGNPLILEVYVNGDLQFSDFLAAVQQINVFAAGGNDTLIVDSTNGLIAVIGGVRYDGDHGAPGQVGAGIGGFDTLSLDQTGGTTQTSDTLALGVVGSGRSTVVGPGTGGTQTVDFQFLEPVLDAVLAAAFSITSVPGIASVLQTDNAITYEAGVLLANAGRFTADTFEPIEFTNKTAVTLDAGAGADTVHLNNIATPTGLTAMTVNVGSGDDAVVAGPNAATPGLTVNGGIGNDFVSANGTLNGNEGNDVLIGGAGGNTLSGGDGEDILDGSGGANTLNGNAGVDTILVSGTAGADTIATTHGGVSFNVTGGPSAGTNTISSVEMVRVELGGGADRVTLNLSNGGGLTYSVLGGDPIGTAGGDVLAVSTAAAVTVTAGPENDAGSVDAATTTPTTVSFDEIERLIIDGGGGAVVNGTNGDDAITVIARDDSTHAGADGVRDFTAVVNAGLEVLYLDQPSLVVNALGGADTVVLRAPAPNGAAWDVDAVVDGGPPSAGSPSGSDRVVVETPGAGAEAVSYRPTTVDAGTLDLVSIGSPVSLLSIEELFYDGEGDGDSLAVVGTAGADTIAHSPGAGDQEGSFRVNGLLAIGYENLGASATLTADGAGAADTLVVLGTAVNDTFTVDAAGAVGLNARLALRTTAVEVLTLEGLLGDDLFDLLPPLPALAYGRVNANGGAHASALGDRTVVRGTAGADAIGVSGQVVTIGGVVAASSGVENIVLDAGGGTDAVTYAGVAGVPEAIHFSSSGSAGGGQISVPGVALVTFTGVEVLDATGNAGATGNEDTLTFSATNAVDRLRVNLAAAGTDADPVLLLRDAAGAATLLTLRNYAFFDTLRVNALEGEDVIDVYTAGGGTSRNLFVDGGVPSGKKRSTDKLTVFYTPPRPSIVHSAATQDPDAGLVDLDYGPGRFLVQYDDVEDVVIKRL